MTDKNKSPVSWISFKQQPRTAIIYNKIYCQPTRNYSTTVANIYPATVYYYYYFQYLFNNSIIVIINKQWWRYHSYNCYRGSVKTHPSHVTDKSEILT